MLRVVSLSLLAAVGIATLAVPAQADHRWRRQHTFFPLIDIFPGGWDDEEDYSYLYGDDEDAPERYLPPRKRAARAEDPWWLYEDSEDLEPVVKKPVQKKVITKKAVAAPAKLEKPVPRPIAKPPLATASAPATDEPTAVPAKKAVVTKEKIEAKPVAPVATAKIQPAPAGKTVGCAAGAAVVTGYGFGDVKPKICTGDTYSYTASRGGKAFVITLTAASGEVVDVKKL